MIKHTQVYARTSTVRKSMFESLETIKDETAHYLKNEQSAIADLRRRRYGLYEDIFVASCVLKAMECQLSFHQTQKERLGTGRVESLRHYAAAELSCNRKWPIQRKGITLADWSTFSELGHRLGSSSSMIVHIKEYAWRSWSKRFPVILERLREHPDLQSLPQVQLKQEGTGSEYDFEFYIDLEGVTASP